VTVSSGLGAFPCAGNLTYSCTKTFVDFLGQGLNYELKNKVDCMSWQAGETSTNMLRKPPGGRVVSVDVAVRGMLKDLGKDKMTYGCRKHA
jgi:short-subunit dehydrogenase